AKVTDAKAKHYEEKGKKLVQKGYKLIYKSQELEKVRQNLDDNENYPASDTGSITPPTYEAQIPNPVAPPPLHSLEAFPEQHQQSFAGNTKFPWANNDQGSVHITKDILNTIQNLAPVELDSTPSVVGPQSQPPPNPPALPSQLPSTDTQQNLLSSNDTPELQNNMYNFFANAGADIIGAGLATFEFDQYPQQFRNNAPNTSINGSYLNNQNPGFSKELPKTQEQPGISTYSMNQGNFKAHYGSIDWKDIGNQNSGKVNTNTVSANSPTREKTQVPGMAAYQQSGNSAGSGLRYQQSQNQTRDSPAQKRPNNIANNQKTRDYVEGSLNTQAQLRANKVNDQRQFNHNNGFHQPIIQKQSQYDQRNRNTIKITDPFKPSKLLSVKQNASTPLSIMGQTQFSDQQKNKQNAAQQSSPAQPSQNPPNQSLRVNESQATKHQGAFNLGNSGQTQSVWSRDQQRPASEFPYNDNWPSLRQNQDQIPDPFKEFMKSPKQESGQNFPQLNRAKLPDYVIGIIGSKSTELEPIESEKKSSETNEANTNYQNTEDNDYEFNFEDDVYNGFFANNDDQNPEIKEEIQDSVNSLEQFFDQKYQSLISWPVFRSSRGIEKLKASVPGYLMNNTNSNRSEVFSEPKFLAETDQSLNTFPLESKTEPLQNLNVIKRMDEDEERLDEGKHLSAQGINHYLLNSDGIHNFRGLPLQRMTNHKIDKKGTEVRRLTLEVPSQNEQFKETGNISRQQIINPDDNLEIPETNPDNNTDKSKREEKLPNTEIPFKQQRKVFTKVKDGQSDVKTSEDDNQLDSIEEGPGKVIEATMPAEDEASSDNIKSAINSSIIRHLIRGPFDEEDETITENIDQNPLQLDIINVDFTNSSNTNGIIFENVKESTEETEQAKAKQKKVTNKDGVNADTLPNSTSNEETGLELEKQEKSKLDGRTKENERKNASLKRVHSNKKNLQKYVKIIKYRNRNENVRKQEQQTENYTPYNTPTNYLIQNTVSETFQLPRTDFEDWNDPRDFISRMVSKGFSDSDWSFLNTPSFHNSQENQIYKYRRDDTKASHKEKEKSVNNITVNDDNEGNIPKKTEINASNEDLIQNTGGYTSANVTDNPKNGQGVYLIYKDDLHQPSNLKVDMYNYGLATQDDRKIINSWNSEENTNKKRIGHHRIRPRQGSEKQEASDII
ncbi:hypothetical protein QYM36_000809, partial [Artemia franciscana]